MEEMEDRINAYAQQSPVEELQSEVLQFLLPSRYCEVDQLGPIAQDLFGWMTPGWTRASAIRDWVHENRAFNYQAARPTKTAMDVYEEQIGVCRDYQHLAVDAVAVPEHSGSRCDRLSGGHPVFLTAGPGDFSAWYEVWLDGRWIAMDARHNENDAWDEYSWRRVGMPRMLRLRLPLEMRVLVSFLCGEQ